MRGIFTMEPKMDEEVIMIPLSTHESMLACFLIVISIGLTLMNSDMSIVIYTMIDVVLTKQHRKWRVPLRDRCLDRAKHRG